MTTALQEKPKRRRWWKWTRRILIGIFSLMFIAIAAVLIFREVRKSQGEKELAAVINDLDRTDPRWRLEHIEEDRPDVPAAENSIQVLHEVYESLVGWNLRDLKIPDQQSTPPWPANQQLSLDHLDRIREALRDREPIVARCASLIRYPRGRAKVGWLEVNPFTTPLPHLNECPKMATLLQLDIERLLHEKSVSGAMDRVRAIINLSQGFVGEPTLMGFLTHLAMRSIAIRKFERILAMAEVPEKDLREIERALQAIANSASFSAALRGERAIANRTFQNLESDKLTLEQLAGQPGAKVGSPDLEGRLLFYIYMANIKSDHAFYLQTMNRAIEWTALPKSSQQAKWLELDDELKSIPFPDLIENGRLLTRLIFPAVHKVFDADQRDSAMFRCAVVLVAVERYRLAHRKWPAKLDDLCPAFLAEVPSDPYDDKPIKYRKSNEGVTVYTCGLDGIDDGGIKLINFREQGSDLGLRLWNSDRRGLPPPKDDVLDDLPLDK